jgi:short-subunit dehydrogenase
MDCKLKPLGEQVVVITGASSGIGLATALAAATKGAQLVLAARSGNTLEELVQSIQASGSEAIHVVADVGHRRHVERIAEEAVRRFGRVDTWINNAGGSIYGRIEEVPEADNRRLFETNFWGVVHGSLVALPQLKVQGGALINVGSETSEAVVPLQGMYSASKHAVKGFTDALRRELIESKVPVSVTLIQPTAVNTPFPENARNYMDHEPKLPTPQIDPWRVAEAILGAAVKPEREVKVGTMARINTAAFKLAPGLADWIARKENDAPPVRPTGALYTAGEKGRVHGRPPEARLRRRPADPR